MNIRETSFLGVKWSSIGTIGRSIFQLLQISILTRFLPQEAFGLVAMALFFVNFSNIFADMGMTAAILHTRNANRKEYSSIYWLNVLVAFALYCLLLIFREHIAAFYNETDLLPIIPILGLNIIIMSAGRQHKTIMQKKFLFKGIAIIELCSYFLGLMAAVILAIKGFGIYSLIYSTLTASFLSNTLYLIYNFKDEPISFRFRIRETKKFLKVGGYNTGSTLLDFFSKESDILIIGGMLGAESLGLYSLSKQIIMKLYAVLNPIIINVLNPIFSSLQNEAVKLKQYALKAIFFISSISIPIYLLVILSSKEILTILYGGNYESGYIVLSFLALSQLIHSINNPSGSLQIATGRTDVGFKWTLIRIVVTPITILFSSQYGINAVAASVALLHLLLLIPLWRIQIKTLANIKLSEYFRQFYKPLLICIFITTSFLLFTYHNELPYHIVINGLIKSITGLSLFAVSIFLLDRKRILSLKETLKTNKQA
ncbi:MAG: MOP flippase family protein [Bacteroidota bacterium]